MFWIISTLFLIVVWCVAVTLAWLINRPELKKIYGEAPYNIYIYGFTLTYIPWLEKRKAVRDLTNSNS